MKSSIHPHDNWYTDVWATYSQRPLHVQLVVIADVPQRHSTGDAGCVDGIRAAQAVLMTGTEDEVVSQPRTSAISPDLLRLESGRIFDTTDQTQYSQRFAESVG